MCKNTKWLSKDQDFQQSILLFTALPMLPLLDLKQLNAIFVTFSKKRSWLGEVGQEYFVASSHDKMSPTYSIRSG